MTSDKTLESLQEREHYPNFETWRVACWLFGDEWILSDHLDDYAFEYEESGKREEAVSTMEMSLWDEVMNESHLSGYVHPAAMEILEHGLGEIDYHAVAEALADAYESGDSKIREWHLKRIRRGGK